VGHVTRIGEKRNMYRLLVGKPEGKRPLGRLRCRWIDNSKMDLLEIELSVVDWIGLAQDRYRRTALDSITFLGIQLDNHLTCKGHINLLLHKLST
jgi:hypothetical protein